MADFEKQTFAVSKNSKQQNNDMYEIQKNKKGLLLLVKITCFSVVCVCVCVSRSTLLTRSSVSIKLAFAGLSFLLMCYQRRDSGARPDFGCNNVVDGFCVCFCFLVSLPSLSSFPVLRHLCLLHLRQLLRDVPRGGGVQEPERK